MEYDFLASARITRVRIASNENVGGVTYRVPTRVRVQYSNVPGFFNDAEEVDLTAVNEVTFSEPIIARFVRLQILEASSPSQTSTTPIGVSG